MVEGEAVRVDPCRSRSRVAQSRAPRRAGPRRGARVASRCNRAASICSSASSKPAGEPAPAAGLAASPARPGCHAHQDLVGPMSRATPSTSMFSMHLERLVPAAEDGQRVRCARSACSSSTRSPRSRRDLEAFASRSRSTRGAGRGPQTGTRGCRARETNARVGGRSRPIAIARSISAERLLLRRLAATARRCFVFERVDRTSAGRATRRSRVRARRARGGVEVAEEVAQPSVDLDQRGQVARPAPRRRGSSAPPRCRSAPPARSPASTTSTSRAGR